MSETIDDLRILAKQVRNASSQGENTAERVGHVMEGTLDLIEGASPDLSKYYTKQESDTLLLSKWTYDAARAASWDAASKDRHTHTNKPALDLIVYDPVKNVWKFTGNAAFSGDVISYANLGDVDIPTIYEGLPIDNKTIKRDINGVLFTESTTGGSFDESSMWTALGTSISSKLIAQRYLNLSGYATEAYVTEKIQGLGAVFNLKGTKATPSDLPTTGNKVGDVWYVASESVGYIWIADEKGVLRWEKFGEPVDLSAYYTKTETNALLANKWTTDTVLISQWNDAYTLRHSHSNKAIIDGITNTLINNWNSASADAHKHANKPALDLIEYDSVKKLWKFTGNAAFSGDVISYANLGDVNIPSIYEGLPIDNVTIKRNSAGALYSLSGSGGDFDKAAMWLALSSSTTEQINKSHLADALSTYVLTTDSRLSDSRNAKDVYAWAKQPTKPTYSYYEINGRKVFYIDESENQSNGFFDNINTFGIVARTNAGYGAYGWLTGNGNFHIQCGREDGFDVKYNLCINEFGGNVGIGVKNPNCELDVNGKIKANIIAINGGNPLGFLKANGSIDLTEYLNSNYYTPSEILSRIKTVDGNGSGLDADLLDGLHKDSFLQNTGVVLPIGTTVDTMPTNLNAGLNGVNIPLIEYNATLQLFDFVGAWAQLRFTPTNSYNRIQYRSKANTTWKEIAYLDDNVASATKLQTARSIFGQQYDGTGNVDGIFRNIVGTPTDYIISSKTLAHVPSPYGLITRIYANGESAIQSQREINDFEVFPLILNPLGGNVGVGKNPTAKFDVNGTGKFANIISESTSFDSFRTKGGIVAEGNTLQLGNIKLVVNPSAKTIRFEMLDGTPCNIVSTGDMIIYN